MLSEADIRRHTSDLHRFITPLFEACAGIREDYPVFSEPSKIFFNHIAILSRETFAYLERFPTGYVQSGDSRIASSRLQSLASLREAWEKLHYYIRPALDADSLHLPTPLIRAFEDLLNSVPDWSELRFVVFHTAEANYLQVPAGLAREIANDIAAIVGGTNFPANLGLIALPYSQASGFFLNCVLMHEMGHFSYQEDSAVEVEEQVVEAIKRIEIDTGTMTNEEVSVCRDMLFTWTEEIFCDLVALSLIGPAFAFAFAELAGAVGILEKQPGDPIESYLFSFTHPASAARFHIHCEMLKKLGWWPIISTWNSSSVEALKHCEKWTDNFSIQSYDLPQSLSDTRFLQAFLEVCSWMMDFLVQKTATVRVGAIESYPRQSRAIQEYLSRAVVPSTVFCDGELITPTALTLMNAGFEFSLENFDLLIERIEDHQTSSIKSRSFLTERLELWILKALEDQRLLVRQVTI